MASVKLENVNKYYNQRIHAVKNVNLDINDQEFIVLVGPSGCGKSTLLRMIAGLEDVTEGSILIDDRVVNNVPPKDRDIAMVFQNYALYPHMSVFDNMAFGLKLRKFSKDEIDKRVHHAAKLLGIEDYLSRKPKELSGGQRQRVAVGRAIVRQPKVFLFDEPLSNLDAKLRVQMRIEISKLHQQLKTTMIYVTHDQVEAMTMGDRIVVLKDGEVQQVDMPMKLYEAPANLFVAGFIGSPAMNFIQGELHRDGVLYFKSDQITIDLSPRMSERSITESHGKAILGIRPEHLIPERNDHKNGAFKALVEVIEPMGAETYAYCKVGGHTLTLRLNPDFKVKVGDTISLKPDLQKIHLFDVQTEKALF